MGPDEHNKETGINDKTKGISKCPIFASTGPHSACISLRVDSTKLKQLDTDNTTLSKALNTTISNAVIGLANEVKAKK